MTDNATLAQMDRAPGYELGGQEFDSLRSHQTYGDGSSMVESWIVIPVAVGSSPILHPMDV